MMEVMRRMKIPGLLQIGNLSEEHFKISRGPDAISTLKDGENIVNPLQIPMEQYDAITLNKRAAQRYSRTTRSCFASRKISSRLVPMCSSSFSTSSSLSPRSCRGLILSWTQMPRFLTAARIHRPYVPVTHQKYFSLPKISRGSFVCDN